MKKYIGFIIVLFIFVFGSLSTEAAVNPNTPCVSTASPSITVLSPNGGEVYNAGQQIEVKWKSCNIPASKLLEINIYSSDPMVFGFLAPTGTVNDGEEVITLNSDLNSGSNYEIVVGVPSYDFNNSALSISDRSDNKFIVKKGSSEVAPKITVLSPNGGEKYLTGQQVTVKWETKGISSSDKVVIVLDPSPETNAMGQDGYNMSGSDGTLNDGIETYTFANGVYGKFKVRVLKLNNNTIKDSSNDYFTIAPLASSILPPGCNSAVGYSGTTGLPCFLDTNPATSITKNSVVLNGRLIANAPSNMYFMYKKAGNGNERQYTAKIVQQNLGTFSYQLSNLIPNTKYEFKACMNYLGDERCAKQLTFTTLPSSEIQAEDTITDSLISVPTTTLPSSPTLILKKGLKSPEVLEIQKVLSKLGYEITADGSFGPKTMNAVKLFQAEKGLTADGVVGPKTWMYIYK